MTKKGKEQSVAQPDKNKPRDDEQHSPSRAESSETKQPETARERGHSGDPSDDSGHNVPTEHRSDAITGYTGAIARWTRILVIVTAVYAVIAAYQTCQVKRSVDATREIVTQNERVIKAAETQADSAQTASLISRQVLVSYFPRLVSLKPNERMLVDVSVANKSSFPASVSGGDVKFVFSESTTAINDFKDTSPLQAVELPVGWEGISYHVGSRILSDKEVADIKEGRLYVFVFMRVFLKGVPNPLESCHFYSTVIKDLGRCER